MKRAPIPGPADRADKIADSPLSLRDIVEALCCGLTPSADSIEICLDRIERTQQ